MSEVLKDDQDLEVIRTTKISRGTTCIVVYYTSQNPFLFFLGRIRKNHLNGRDRRGTKSTSNTTQDDVNDENSGTSVTCWSRDRYRNTVN